MPGKLLPLVRRHVPFGCATVPAGQLIGKLDGAMEEEVVVLAPEPYAFSCGTFTPFELEP